MTTPTPEEIKADIVATRAELAETADALAAQLKRKGRAGARIAAAIAGAGVLILVVQRIRAHRAS
jgi:hypothetical protein